MIARGRNLQQNAVNRSERSGETRVQAPASFISPLSVYSTLLIFKSRCNIQRECMKLTALSSCSIMRFTSASLKGCDMRSISPLKSWEQYLLTHQRG